jgi:hypothetical protein
MLIRTKLGRGVAAAKAVAMTNGRKTVESRTKAKGDFLMEGNHQSDIVIFWAVASSFAF